MKVPAWHKGIQHMKLLGISRKRLPGLCKTWHAAFVIVDCYKDKSNMLAVQQLLSCYGELLNVGIVFQPVVLPTWDTIDWFSQPYRISRYYLHGAHITSSGVV